MKKVYAVYHWWEETYYNASQWKSELICCFDNLKEAEEFKKKYSLPYDNTPWALQEGQIEIKELPTTYDESKFKWLRKPKEPKNAPKIKYVTSEELKQMPKSGPMFFEFSEDELDF